MVVKGVGKDGLGVQKSHLEIFLSFILLPEILHSLLNTLLALDWPRVSCSCLQGLNVLFSPRMLCDCSVTLRDFKSSSKRGVFRFADGTESPTNFI